MVPMLALASLVASAQINHESLLVRAQEPGWGVGGGVGAATVSGNFSFLDVGADAFVHGRTPFPDAPNDQFWFRDRLLVYGRYHTQSLFGDRIRLERLAHLRYTRMFVHRFGLEVFAQEQNDQVLMLDNRFVTGIEPRFVLVHEEKLGLWAATGYMFEFEDRAAERLVDPEPEQTIAHRSTTYVALNWHPSEHVSVSNTGFAQPKLTDPRDIHLLDELELVVGVTEVLSLSSGVRVRYDSEPPSALEPLDVASHHGLRVDL